MAETKTALPGRDRIAESLFGQTRRRLLALFFARPPQYYFLRQIARESGTGVGAVQRELKRLENAELIRRMVVGSQVHFTANTESPVYQELRGLLLKTSGLAEVIRGALLASPIRDSIDVALIYGSVARGQQSASSDVDLIVIGAAQLKDLLIALRGVQEEVGREITPTIYDRNDFNRRALRGNHFLKRVLAGDHIMVIGTEDDLGRLAHKPLA